MARFVTRTTKRKLVHFAKLLVNTSSSLSSLRQIYSMKNQWLKRLKDQLMLRTLLLHASWSNRRMRMFSSSLQSMEHWQRWKLAEQARSRELSSHQVLHQFQLAQRLTGPTIIRSPRRTGLISKVKVEAKHTLRVKHWQREQLGTTSKQCQKMKSLN